MLVFASLRCKAWLWLTLLGFIDIKWPNITGTGIKVLDTNGDGKLDGEDIL